MKRNRDKEVIQVFLDCYNTLGGADYQVVSYPDEETRNQQSVDALCRNSQGKTLALEHTRVEAFPGEMADGARFLDVMGQHDKNPNLAEPGFQTASSIPVGSVPTGVNWETLSRDIGIFLKQCFPFEEKIYTFTQGRVSIPINITKLPIASSPGSFLVERSWPRAGNQSTIEKCFADKLPKLRAAPADLKILLLEQPSIAASVSMDLFNYAQDKGRPEWLPDGIWLARTAALNTERYTHVSELHPLVMKKANWKNGQVS